MGRFHAAADGMDSAPAAAGMESLLDDVLSRVDGADRQLISSLAAATSLARAVAGRDPAQLLGILVTPAVHFSYGLGFARALLAWMGRREELREHAI